LGTDDTTRDTRSIVAQVYALREEGLGAYCHTGGYHVPPVTLTGSVRDDIVFIDPVIGVGELAISDHRSSQPALNELLRVASEAHVAGLITGKAGIVHLHVGDGNRGLDLVRQALVDSEIPARVFNPTHINRIPALLDEATELARQGSHVDATAFPVDEDDQAVDAALAYVRYADAGGPTDRFTISSDGGGCLPVFDENGKMTSMDIGQAAELPRTFRQLIHLGVPVAQALRCFTVNPATLLRLNDRGRIATGKRADLMLMDNDYAITDVMINGEWHVRESSAVRRGQFESTSKH
jgi:beta-aspartyl-dipeptidase (metallo-type)